METDYASPFGDLTLLPDRANSNPNLRAWDAADDYLLSHLAENPPPPGARIAILNDRFGALVTALASYRPLSAGDSLVAQLSAHDNLDRNGLSGAQPEFRDSLYCPPPGLDYLLIKVPKSLALLEDQLCRYLPALGEGAVIIGAGMARDIHTSTLALFERLGGGTRTSLARRKARLIFCQQQQDPPAASPYPTVYDFQDHDLRLSNHANVFSRGRPDIGTRFLLEHLPQTRGPVKILDLACGNGVLGIQAARLNPQAEVTFVDESYMAVESARLNVAANLPPGTQVQFHVSDCLDALAEQRFDLILNNPPFHQQQTVHDGVARRMFKAAHKALAPGGELWVVANRHLGYHVRLKQLFGHCRTPFSNRKFVILKAGRRD
ncbi:methyltransferase [Granulosicoccaceae sp. 1_MG-2023]|nr:methyltransferase [Granulosicoccaceae sp. 1_MG-2023]